jgi:hypothetical protein
VVHQPLPQSAGALGKDSRQFSGVAAMRGSLDLLAHVLTFT